MGQIKFDELNHEKVKELQKKVEEHSDDLMSIVNAIIEPYCNDLDRYVMFIRDCLKDGEEPPTNEELDDFCMNLSTLIYFAGGMCEQLGIRDDISKSVYKEVYHTARASQNTGTVADKDSLAELYSQQEQITNICYNRAYKIMKSKVVEEFGIHAFLASNTVTNEYYPMLAKILFELAVRLQNETGCKIAFINLSGGIGIPYRPGQEKNDIHVIQ